MTLKSRSNPPRRFSATKPRATRHRLSNGFTKKLLHGFLLIIAVVIGFVTVPLLLKSESDGGGLLYRAGKGVAVQGRRRDVSMGVLFHGEYESLKRAVASWREGGLLEYVGEVIYFLNGVDGVGDFERVMGKLIRDDGRGGKGKGKGKGGMLKVRVVNSRENLRLGLAIGKMVEMSLYEEFLLMEKDWALVESEGVMVGMMDGARFMVGNGVDVVRFRSRARPGAPLHARIMHEGREDSMLRQQKNLFCFAHHWLQDPVRSYPQYFQECPGRKGWTRTSWERIGMDRVVCSKAEYCQWTNNPCMFKKKWFLKELFAPFMDVYSSTVKHDPHSNMLDFEFFTNWDMKVWNKRDFVVALPKGLFEHSEVNEQNTMNTVWYAWRRLDTDVEEFRNEYLSTERKLRKSQRLKHNLDRSIDSTFPLDFVRLYHYPKAMSRPLDEAVEEIDVPAENSRKQLEKNEGTWRHAVTAVTDKLHECMLYSPVVEPKNMKIAFVTSLFDAERKPELFKVRIVKLAKNLHMLRAYPRIVYTTKETIGKLEKLLPEDASKQAAVYFIPTSHEVLIKDYVSQEQYERMEDIHAWSAWGMAVEYSKPYFLRDAAVKRKIFKRTHYVYIDATTDCLSIAFKEPETLSPSNDHVLRAHLINNFFVLTASKPMPDLAHFPMRDIAGHMDYRGIPPSSVELMQDGLFGGTPLTIAAIISHYDAIARYTLKEGHLANVKIIMSIALKNVGYHFTKFNIDNICTGHPSDSIGCRKHEIQKKESERACAIFKWAAAVD